MPGLQSIFGSLNPHLRLGILALTMIAPILADQLPVSADAHVNPAFPAVNFGNSPFLQVGGGSRAFLRFDLSSLPPGVAASPLARVNLVLWVNRVTSAGSVQVSQVSSLWDETSLTASGQPSSGGSVGTALAVSGSQFVTIDVTS